MNVLNGNDKSEPVKRTNHGHDQDIGNTVPLSNATNLDNNYTYYDETTGNPYEHNCPPEAYINGAIHQGPLQPNTPSISQATDQLSNANNTTNEVTTSYKHMNALEVAMNVVSGHLPISPRESTFTEESVRRYRADPNLTLHPIGSSPPLSQLTTTQDNSKNASTSNVNVITRKRDTEYKCAICNKIFQRKDHLKSHSKSMHEDTKRYECPTCASKFKLKHNLTQHQRIHQKNTMVACHICDTKFKNDKYLNIHKNKFHRAKCQTCTFSAISQEALKEHSSCRRCTKQDCEFVTQNERQLLLHTVRCYGYIECPKCSRKFKYIKDLHPYDRHVTKCKG